MKKSAAIYLAAILCLFLISWGYDGHYAVGKIAENHLTPAAALAVKDLLGNQTMAEVSSYADELRSQAVYKGTAELHFLNIPMGLSYDEFSTYVKNNKQRSVYNGILGCIQQLRDPAVGKVQKAFSLELLIHFVGDCHQPMHVSRAEDRGGNKTAVTFLGRGTDLHGLWDYGLLQHQNISYKNLAAKYDDATPAQITKWQNDSLMIWLWESYQITTILYKEAEENPTFDEKYYQDHIPIIKSRIEKAGIRLAGVLNGIFVSPKS